MSVSPTLSTIRSAVKTAIQTAMNSGSPSSVVTVHDYRRFWRDGYKFQSLFKRTDNASGWSGVYNGWMMKITSQEKEAPEWFRFFVLYRIELDGYLAVNDTTKTQKDLLDQVDAIKDQLRGNLTIFGNTEMSSPVSQLEDSDAEDFGDITAWHVRLTLEVEAIETKFV